MYAICGAKYEVIAAEHDYDIRFSQKVFNLIKKTYVLVFGLMTSYEGIWGNRENLHAAICMTSVWLMYGQM